MNYFHRSNCHENGCFLAKTLSFYIIDYLLLGSGVALITEITSGDLAVTQPFVAFRLNGENLMHVFQQRLVDDNN